MIKFIIIPLAVLASFLYRRGGTSAGTLWRDLGVPLVALIACFIIGVRATWWLWILSFGLLYGSLTTYNKWMNKFFGHSKDDVHWYGWAMTGFSYGCAFLPFYYIWHLVLLRAVLLGLLVMIWSVLISWDKLEEWGRGFLIVSSVLLLSL